MRSPLNVGINKKKLTSLIFSTFLLLPFYSLSYDQELPKKWLTFNTSENDELFDSSGYRYVKPGEVGCSGWNTHQSAICNTRSRLHWYYNHSNSDHMGWLRYGSVYKESEGLNSTGALGLFATGGTKRGQDRKTVLLGSPIRTQSELNQALKNNREGDFANEALPGSIPIYFKNNSPTEPIPAFHGMNRFTTWVKLPASHQRRKNFTRQDFPQGRPDKTISWYPFLHDSRGGHYYHHISNRPTGGWILVQWDAHPTHHNAGPYATHHAFNEGGREYQGQGRDYFSNIAAFSFVYHSAANSTGVHRVITDEWELYHQKHENDETLGSLAIGYDPEFNDFDISFEDKYRCSVCKGKYSLWVSKKPFMPGEKNEAIQVRDVDNFFSDDNNKDGFIIKPNTHYNQVWARFRLPSEFNVSKGDSFYIAVLDETDRQLFGEEIDRELIYITDNIAIPKQELWKSIRYTWHKEPEETLSLRHIKNLIKHESEQRVTTLSSSIWEDGFHWVPEISDKFNVSVTFPKKQETDIVISSNHVGEGFVAVRLYNGNKLLDRAIIQVINQRIDCRVKKTCDKSTLVKFGNSATSHDLPYTQWHSVIKDIYTNPYPDGGMGITVGSNGAYQFAGITGNSHSLKPTDVIVFDVENTTSSTITLAPRISFSSNQRYDTTSNSWQSLPSKQIQPGETITFEMQAYDIPHVSISTININLPINLRGVLLKSISIYSERTLYCQGCMTTLVDFYSDGTNHSAPFSDWDEVLQDVYTGKVGDMGSGIIIGQNGTYNYQGIRGKTPLPSTASNIVLRWRNESNETIRFRPRISFNDPDRPVSGIQGDWALLDEVVLTPYATKHHYVGIPEGEFFLVNVSINHNQQRKISLTKIAVD